MLFLCFLFFCFFLFTAFHPKVYAEGSLELTLCLFFETFTKIAPESVQVVALSNAFLTQRSSPASVPTCAGLWFGARRPNARGPVLSAEVMMSCGGVSDLKGTR